MTLDLTTIILVLLAAWFFGSMIKRMLNGAADMASKEFLELQADQTVRITAQAIKRTAELEKMKDKPFLTAEEILANYSKATERSGDDKSNSLR